MTKAALRGLLAAFFLIAASSLVGCAERGVHPGQAIYPRGTTGTLTEDCLIPDPPKKPRCKVAFPADSRTIRYPEKP